MSIISSTAIIPANTLLARMASPQCGRRTGCLNLALKIRQRPEGFVVRLGINRRPYIPPNPLSVRPHCVDPESVRSNLGLAKSAKTVGTNIALR
jgi:hypothetical protein